MLLNALAILNDERNVPEKLYEATKEFLAPLVGIEFSAQAVINSIAGKDQYGKDLYSDTSTIPWAEKRLRQANAFWNAVGPTPLVKNLPNIYRSRAEQINPIADKLGLPQLATLGSTQYKDFSAVDEISPAPSTRIPVDKVVQGKAYQQAADEKIAMDTVTAPWAAGSLKQMRSSPGTVSKEAYAQAVKDFLVYHDRSWKPVVESVGTALELGIIDKKGAKDALKAANVSEGDVNSILRGEVPQYKPPKDLPESLAQKIGHADQARRKANERARIEKKVIREQRWKK